jgi:hypothetical protein
MEYTVATDKKVCGKINGEKLTVDDIIANGGKVDRLLAAGLIKKAVQTPKTTQEPQVQKEEPQAFVFNNVKYEGDK